MQIATKIELFILSPGEDPGKAHFKRLGYLSFDSNERSNHQARELKSVHVNIAAQHIKLVVHRCHVNKLNIYNQAGDTQRDACRGARYVQRHVFCEPRGWMGHVS